jgi:hypothetical protein
MYRGGGVKDEDHSSVHLKDISFFENPFIQEIARWAVTEVFQKIWTEEKWDKCAKGGDAQDPLPSLCRPQETDPTGASGRGPEAKGGSCLAFRRPTDKEESRATR